MEIKDDKKEENFAVLLEDLASLETYARDLFTFLPLPVCLVSSIGIILEVNPAFEKISGYKIEEIIGQSVDSILDQAGLKELSEETFKKGFVEAKEIDILRQDKKKIPVRTSTILRKTEKGEIIGYFIAFFDLTDIKKKERELQDAQIALLNMLDDTAKGREMAEAAKNETLTIISNFADGLLVFNRESKLSLINPKAIECFKAEAKKIIGKSVSELGQIPVFRPLTNILGADLTKVFRKEITLRENLVLEVTILPLLEKKEKIGTLVIVHDITREKLIEKMKTEFVSLAAHQLRTPLSAIKWTLKMLLDGDLGEITKEQKGFIEKTYQSNERIISLINDLLDVTRIEEGRYIYNPQPFQIEKVVQSVIDFYQEEIKKKKLKFEFKKPKKKLPKVKIDAEKMKLVIQNLLDNAIRYTSLGGEVTVSLKDIKKGIEFQIHDTGVGIPKDQQERVFTKFFRAANAIRMDTEGSGLGLYIAKNIIEAHDGKIWFESQEEEGTTFYFTIPIKEEFTEFLKTF